MKTASQEQISSALQHLQAHVLIDKSLNQREINNILKKQYRILSFQYHPDRNPKTEKKFLKINESYQFLEKILTKNFDFFHSCLSEEVSLDQKIYHLYKTACQNYSSALENYFSQVKMVDLQNNSAAYQELSKALQANKEQFASVIKQQPAGLWTADAIDKINKINIWLGS